MPQAAPKPCSYPGCGQLVRDGTTRCQAHKHVERKQADAARGSAHERGYTSAWRRASKGFLLRHPLCRSCEAKGETVPATVVDHIVPHRGDRALFWQSTNWQSLCKTCHDSKTAREDGGFGRSMAS